MHAISALRPQGMELLMGGSSDFDVNTAPQKVVFMPVIPLHIFSGNNTNTQKNLDILASYYSESLVMDAMNLGNVLGTKISTSDPQTGSYYIQQLLYSGFAYVIGNDGKLLPLLNMNRSVLYIGNGIFPWMKMKPGNNKKDTNISVPPVHPLIKRMKETSRILRNKMPLNSYFRLTVNTSIPLAISKLREHHGDDCWIGDECASVWTYMATLDPPQFLVFEQWFNDIMVAADFGHPTANGRSIYIATRFFDRDPPYRLMAPGFILALAECCLLKKYGCYLWDLGGFDSCPLMQYKKSLTGNPLSRPVALQEFRRARDDMSSLPPSRLCELTAGVLIDRLSIEDMMLFS